MSRVVLLLFLVSPSAFLPERVLLCGTKYPVHLSSSLKVKEGTENPNIVASAVLRSRSCCFFGVHQESEVLLRSSSSLAKVKSSPDTPSDSIEMARGEGDSSSGGLKSHFVERVVKLPMMHVVLDYASNTYSHIKESNKLVNFTLTNAEKTATFVAGQAKPVVLRFEKQIQAVDDLACKGLGTLEEKVPFITKPADEIIGDTRKLYDDTVNSRLENIKKYSNETVRTAADLSLRGASAILGEKVVNTIVKTVDGLLVVSQSYVDYVLPPTKDEQKKKDDSKESEKETPSSLVRLTRLSNTIRHRVLSTLVVKWENVQERSLDLVLTYPIQMIELTKTQLEPLFEYLTQLWESLRKESPETESTDKSQAPGALIAAKDGALWVLGMIKLVPQLLPMYIYGLVSWIEEKRKPAGKDEIKVNGVGEHSNSNNHH